MRLKEDSNNYNAESVRNKEYRHSPLEDTVVSKKSKKDTKRWCKGIEGREHEWEMTIPKNDARFKRLFWRLNICKNCGKQDYRSTEYWCEEHKVWDKRYYFGEHKHS